jgi:hypothetical protein
MLSSKYYNHLKGVPHAANAPHQRDENLRIGKRPIPLRIFASFAPSRFIFAVHLFSYFQRRNIVPKEKFLTVGWNNALTLGLGFIVLIYVIFALSNSTWSESGGFIRLAILGALY